jgi:flagellar hook-associated protein FlgK
MSLNGALQIGRSALSASQAAIQVAGNNMANA